MPGTHASIAVVNGACQGMLRACRNFRYGYDVLRIALGLLLLGATALKGYQLATEPVVGTGLLNSRWFLMATVEFELFFGLWLLAGVFPRSTQVVAIGCFALFGFVSLWKALGGEATCGCFGNMSVNPWLTASFDWVIVISLLCCRPKGLTAPFNVDFKQVGVRLVGVFAIWLLVGVPAGFAMGGYPEATLSDAGTIIGDGKIIILKPETWTGKRFPLLGQIDIGDRLSNGLWLVLLHSHNCSACREAASGYESLARDFSTKSTCPRSP